MADSPAELFDRFHLAIYRYLLRMTGRTDVAEDLTQDVFVRVLRGGDTPEVRYSERAWLFAIARNLFIDWHRRTVRNPVQPVGEECSGLLEERASGEPRYDIAFDVGQALQQLEDADREAFLLRVVGGLGHEEIASLTGTTRASARSRIFRARSTLRAALAPAWRAAAGGRIASPGDQPVRRLRVVP